MHPHCSGGIFDDAVSAAERPKNVAPGASPGYRNQHTLSPEGAKDSAATLSPLPGAGFNTDTEPRARARGYVLTPLRGEKAPDPHFVANRLLATKRRFDSSPHLHFNHPRRWTVSGNP